ncbi:processive 1,2-diacylglycerol beta-glucosyltransferase [Brevibacillus aydinogluensis]|uniref:Glycosyl transferase n=1 Tax=Brevibacillus aydinogluensis TaxID=927786 RepID=A0AA48RGH5_9BACL|nr:glycosyl transferase [Brevibacillus aydinogluensis]MDT3416676.1 processive 1,2-diacylglycerol beta-glucosyltransferase [Brevibacillus aydinogluensis]CAJ1001766.1 Glycosyl transferase [Brevibacillus aydinogluensis]
MNGKRLLVVTEEWAGSGHRMAAEALREAVVERCPDVYARVEGGLQAASPALRELSRFFYGQMLRYSPTLWQRLYDREQMWGTALAKPIGAFLARRLIRDLLEREQPDVVAATHAYCLPALAHARKKAGKRFRLVSIPTDFHVHRFWVHPEIDGYVVAHERLAELLERRHGVKRERIHVYGIPVRPVFAAAAREEKAYWKARMGLSPDQFTVLVCGGEGGHGGMEEVVRSLLNVPEPLHIVVITGKNEPIRQRLSLLAGQPHPLHRLVVKGYEPSIWEWIGAADAYVTKPGGISCAEALALRTPLILYRPLPGQERHNLSFLLQHKAAAWAERSEEIARLIVRWRCNPEEREEMVRRMDALRQPDAARRIADFLLSL